MTCSYIAQVQREDKPTNHSEWGALTEETQTNGSQRMAVFREMLQLFGGGEGGDKENSSGILSATENQIKN